MPHSQRVEVLALTSSQTLLVSYKQQTGTAKTTMGNAQSNAVQKKLSKELPPVKKMGHDDAHGWTDLGMKVFSDDEDRNQFIG